MRIGIDYTAAAWQGAGIGRYTRELTRAVIERGRGLRFSLFYAAGWPGAADPPFLAELRRLCAAHPHVRAAPIPLPPRRLTQLWHRLRAPLPVELFTGRLDVLHAPDYVLPPTVAPRRIVTIHDLSYLVHPECAVPSVARYLSDAVPRSLTRATGVLADSQATKRDMVRLLGVPEERISVVYPGVGTQFRPLPPEECEPVRRKLGLPERFILFVSTLEPRKNLVRLVEAFAMLAQGSPAVLEDSSHNVERSRLSVGIAEPSTFNAQRVHAMHLVIAGRKGWMYEPIFAAIERSGVAERVRWLDYLDDADLPMVYNLAWVFAYPSIYEGFGFPPLEALACGAPVVAADNSSLPEAVGAAGLLVPADDTAAIARALGRVADDAMLRAWLREAGPIHARTFTWERAARQVLEHYGSM
jgi:glycosyltransferase involved in cell wall biosynthesis